MHEQVVVIDIYAGNQIGLPCPLRTKEDDLQPICGVHCLIHEELPISFLRSRTMEKGWMSKMQVFTTRVAAAEVAAVAAATATEVLASP